MARKSGISCTFAGGALSFLDEQLSEMWSVLNGVESSPSTKLRVLNLWVWMSKALLMRGHPRGMDTAIKVGALKLSFLA